MNIGLDIDNVVSNFDKNMLEEFLKEDKNKRNNGIINSNAKHITEGMFDWSKEEVHDFFCKNMERIASELEPRDGAKYYIDKMIKDGNKIFLISHRKYPHYINPEKTTVDWLNRNSINYDKLILTKSTDKSTECVENNIDIMFDDVVYNCQVMKQAGINCYLMQTQYNKASNQEMPYVSNWHQLYIKVCDLASKKLPKVHVILDTDTNNEADDQFALSYLLKSNDRVILDAVTIAPYYHENSISIKEGIDLSYKVCKDIFNLCNVNGNNLIFKGSTNYFKNGYIEENDAIKNMLRVINKNEVTYILAIGALTNIAVLLKLHPEVKEKIKLIWLGGNDISCNDNREYNFKQDIDAVRFVYQQNLDLMIIPCMGVASNLTTSIYELRSRMDINNNLCKYLYDRFYNDGENGETIRRVIWDISVIAYINNPYLFEIKQTKIPNILDNLSYDFENSKNNNKIKFVVRLDQDYIYYDLFNKLKNN